jgi:hypothetical protein
MVSREVLVERLAATSLDAGARDRIAGRIERDFGGTADAVER